MNRDDGHPYLRTFTAGPSAAGPERSAIGPLLPPGGGTDRDRGAVEGTCRAVCLPRESGVFRPAGRFCRLREKDRMGVRARGFTLIELMVVMVLIALLLTIAVPRYFSTIDNGRQSVQRQNISAIRDAIDKYYGDQGKYPPTLQDLVDKRYLRAVRAAELGDRAADRPQPDRRLRHPERQGARRSQRCERIVGRAPGRTGTAGWSCWRC
jgi:prepilin-type N-terminal cleavage/methylation domain-containing protein